MAGYFHHVQAQTMTRFWINNVTREETRLAIEAGARGCTQNPFSIYYYSCFHMPHFYRRGQAGTS